MQLSSRVDILGVPVHPYPSVDALHHDLHDLITRRQHALVLNVNAHALNLAYEQAWLKDMFKLAEIVFCDSKGVIVAGRLLGHYIPISIGYGYWIWELSRFLAQHEFSIFLLGGKPGIAEAAAARLTTHNPALRIAGTHHGYFDKTASSAENAAVIGRINAAQPDVLLVCFGMPLQEKWLHDYWGQINAGVALTGGAALDYTAGQFPRAPRWVSSIGFEWFWRMFFEPRRLWRRYVIGNPLFILRVLHYRITRGRQC